MTAMPPYPVLCHAGCSRPAAFKLGAVWADGNTRELKTYSLCCSDCLPAELTAARTRRERCRVAPGEDLGPVCVFEMRSATRDRELVRREDLEPGGRLSARAGSNVALGESDPPYRTATAPPS